MPSVEASAQHFSLLPYSPASCPGDVRAGLALLPHTFLSMHPCAHSPELRTVPTGDLDSYPLVSAYVSLIGKDKTHAEWSLP